MKSAKRMKHKSTTVLFILVILSLTFSCVGCDRQSLFAPLWQETPIPEPDRDAMSDGTEPEPEEPAPIFYNQLTGLVCDEALSSYRPISVCVGGFDELRQEALSLADVVVEAPISGGLTRLWAIYGTPSAATQISHVSPAKDYMLPIADSFGAITVFAGQEATHDSAYPYPTRDRIDSTDARVSDAFRASNGVIFTDGASLLSMAERLGLPTLGAISLPFVFPVPDTAYAPCGNAISSIRFSFSEGNTVSFSFDPSTGVYTHASNSASNDSPCFNNVLLLFHNVSYYHSTEGTSFSLDTAAGGTGFCYTGGTMTTVTWQADENGLLSFYDAEGTPLTVNRGKTYIGMLRITDSATVIAK